MARTKFWAVSKVCALLRTVVSLILPPGRTPKEGQDADCKWMKSQLGLVDHGQVVFQRPMLESGDPLFSINCLLMHGLSRICELGSGLPM